MKKIYVILTLQGLQLMHDLGICVSPRSVLRKKRDLVAEQKEKIKSTVTAYVQQREKSAINPQPLEMESSSCLEGEFCFLCTK